jgi:hypothetical protein
MCRSSHGFTLTHVFPTSGGGSADAIVSMIEKSTIAEKVCDTLCEVFISVFMIRYLHIRGRDIDGLAAVSDKASDSA